jgi:hypothetical protein
MGCGTTTRVSILRPVDYEPVVADSVEVFFASGDIRGPYQEIAVITAVPTSSADAKIDTGDETAIIQALREKAGEVGAERAGFSSRLGGSDPHGSGPTGA